MTDYPDWTESIELLGSEIQLPIDIQGAYIQLPVDIQGQYIDVAVDIVAQSVGNIAIDIAAQSLGNIAIDIAAQSVGNLNVNIASSSATLNVAIQSSAATLNVNLQSQSANINIDIEAQSVGVYLQPEWAAKQQTDKDFIKGGSNIAPGDYVVETYTIPQDKTLFVSCIAGYAYATEQSYRDNNQMCAVAIYDATANEYKFYLGGNGGAGICFTKPYRFPGGHQVWFMIFNFSNHNQNMRIIANGYEI